MTMRKIAIVLACALTLSGCKTVGELLAEGREWIAGIDAGAAKIRTSIQKRCAATQIILDGLYASAQARGGQCKVMATLTRVQATKSALCDGVQPPSDSPLANLSALSVEAERAYQTATAARASGC